MSRKVETPTIQPPKVLLLGIQAPYNHIANIDSYFEEFVNLVASNRTVYDYFMKIKLRSVDSAYFLTKGKLAEVKEFCDTHHIEEVIISEPLTARQERNLIDYLGCKVFDRTRLILEIFEKAAHSAEGKAQVAIAMWQHQKSRLAGKGVELSQQSGIMGTRGPGETAKEKEMRHIEQHIHRLRKQLKTIERARETQRKRRLAAKLPLICLIGYTNAGKSTILNALTRSDVYAEDKLFATLDTTTRELYIDHKKVALISDTVGFIQQLPHQLVEAFKSTLSELQYANLLLHVVDVSDPNMQDHINVVHDILDELGIHKDMLYVFNKADKVKDIEKLKPILFQYEPHVVTDARSKDGLNSLRNFIRKWSTE